MNWLLWYALILLAGPGLFCGECKFRGAKALNATSVFAVFALLAVPLCIWSASLRACHDAAPHGCVLTSAGWEPL